jgi:hypothetical protein
LDQLLRALPDSAVPLAVHSTLQQEDGASPDRLHAMFWDRAGHGDYARRMYARQIVHSEYALDHLRRRRDVSRVLDTFRKAVALRPKRTLQGRYFELLIHKFVEKNHNLSTADARCRLRHIDEVVWSDESTWDGDLLRLERPNQYWIPRTRSLRSVDAALVHNETLCTFRITVNDTRAFTETAFRKDFSTVRARVPFTEALHYVLHPHDASFTLQSTIKSPGTQSQHQVAAPVDSFPIKFKLHAVDATSIETLARSMMALFHEIEGPKVLSDAERLVGGVVLDHDIASDLKRKRKALEQRALEEQRRREGERRQGRQARLRGREGPGNPG